MPVALTRKEEDLFIEIPGDSGNGTPGRIYYCRMPETEFEKLMIRFGTKDGAYEPDQKKWPTERRRSLFDEVVRYGFKRGQGFVVRQEGKTDIEAALTVDDVLGMPALYMPLHKAIMNHVLAVPKDEMLGNSSATSGQ